MKPETEHIFKKACRTIERINSCRQHMIPDFCANIKEVIVIASSSRGGSSLFSEILRHSPELLHFKGEINPFLTLAGLSYPHSGRAGDLLDAQDVGPHNAAKLLRFEREMALDVALMGEVNLGEDIMLSRFIHDLRWRLGVQWPEIDFDPGVITTEVKKVLAELCRQHGWQAGSFKDPQLFHTLFLRNIRQKYKGVNPYYYDLRPDLLQRYCPDAKKDSNSPSSCIIEEPPFVPIVPRPNVSAQMAKTKPLIFKTPSNVYRLNFLKKAFPNAKFRILHLVRNPADSINGLIDGWRYNGFFSHEFPRKLNISGYSDKFPLWGKSWWKYDLPPDWQEWINRPLEYVCGFQWRSAHQAILDYTEQNQTDFLRVKFEDVVGPISTRRQVFSRIAQWLGITGDEIIKAAVADDLPPIMATTTMPPLKRRWFEKTAIIRPVLTDPQMEILSTAARLGYKLDEEINA